MQPLALDPLLLLGRETIRLGTGIIDELSEQDRLSHSQLSSRPPVVKAPQVVLPLRGIPLGLPVDRLQRERHLDELALDGGLL